MRRRYPLVVALALIFAAAPVRADLDHRNAPADDFPSDAASVWFELIYDVVKAERTPPPGAARVYGISAVALYESLAAGTESHRSLVGQLNGLTAVPQPKPNKKHYWPAVASAALATTIRGLYPTMSSASANAVAALEASLAAEHQAATSKPEYERSIAHGGAVADAVLAWAATDGLATLNNCPYVPAAVPGAWQPAPGAGPNPLQPCWGQLRPMVLHSGSECPPTGHPTFSTEPGTDFYAAGLEVYTVSQSLTDEQKTIANYWADGPGATGTPAGHWVAIASQFVRNDDLSLAAAAEAYARVGIAVHDAFIACWNAKYATNLQRPVTYIRANIDATWSPFIATPGFPTYTSGHSTQSGAAAYVLTDMFGVRSFTDTTHADHGLAGLAPRTFDSFDDASSEAAVSRLYGGIHYSFDNEHGLTCGRCIGQTIVERVRFRMG
jgi:hypothetical protein